MKNPAKFLIYLCLAVAWCVPFISKSSQWHYFLFIGCFCLGAMILLTVKNKQISLPLAIISIIPPVFFNHIYLLYSVGTIILIGEYVSVCKITKPNKKTGISRKKARIKKTINQEKISAFSKLPLLSCTAFVLTVFISVFVLISGKYSVYALTLGRYNSSHFVLLAVLIFLIVLSVTVFLQKSNTALNSLNVKLFYLSAPLCFLLNLLMFFLTDISTVSDSEKLFFFPWLIFLGILTYKNDPAISLIINKIMPVQK